MNIQSPMIPLPPPIIKNPKLKQTTGKPVKTIGVALNITCANSHGLKGKWQTFLS